MPPPAALSSAVAACADAIWFYDTPKKGVQGPFSLAQLASFREYLERAGYWATLRVWCAGQSSVDGVLLASLLP